MPATPIINDLVQVHHHDSDDGDWDETDVIEQHYMCQSLFSEEQFPSAILCLAYDSKLSDFDLISWFQRPNFSFYDCVKSLNFIRRRRQAGASINEIVEAVQSDARPWDDDVNFIPVIEDDALLFSFEDAFAGKANAVAMDSVETRLAALAEENRLLKLDMEAMKATFKRSVGLEEETPHAVDTQASLTRSNREVEKGYLGCYSALEIHEEMLRDRVRTNAYRDFILGNRSLFEGKTVLDVGCGTGILCMFAAQAGAAKVIGIDQADIIEHARQVVAANGFSDQIQLVRGHLEDLVEQKVDIIISEWMGYFLVFESMLSTVLVARDRWVGDPSNVFPNKATMFVCGGDSRRQPASSSKFWSDVYGFDMSCLPKAYSTSLRSRSKPGVAMLETISAECIVTNEAVLKAFDISTVQDAELDFHSDFVLNCVAVDEVEVDVLVVYFTCDFGDASLPTSVRMTTAPSAPRTHWHQTLLFLEQPWTLRRGQQLCGRLQARRPPTARRHYEIVAGLSRPGEECRHEQVYALAD